MKTLTGAERIFSTLKHQEPDRVPRFEMFLDPNTRMDIGEVKEKYGDKITLLGNVDCAYTLT